MPPPESAGPPFSALGLAVDPGLVLPAECRPCMPLVSAPAGAMLSLTAPPAAPEVSEPAPAAPGLTLLDDVSAAPVVSVTPTPPGRALVSTPPAPVV